MIEADNARRGGAAPRDSSMNIEVLQASIAAVRSCPAASNDTAALHGQPRRRAARPAAARAALAAAPRAPRYSTPAAARSLRRAAIEAHTAGALHKLGRDDRPSWRAQLAVLTAPDPAGAPPPHPRATTSRSRSRAACSDGAIEQLRAALATLRRPRGRSVPLAHGNLARELAAAGRADEAREQALAAVERAREIFGANSLELAVAEVARGDVALQLDDAAAAVAAYTTALALRERLGAPLHLRARTQLALAQAHARAGATPTRPRSGARPSRRCAPRAPVDRARRRDRRVARRRAGARAVIGSAYRCRSTTTSCCWQRWRAGDAEAVARP
ncbi:MAG: tetratricopeptide repeat protein [Nannocystaceae bacterium]